MGRDLDDPICEVTFKDNVSGTEMTHYYIMPTTTQRARYVNGQVTRVGNKIVVTSEETKLKAGLAIYRGFKLGAFKVNKKDISSDPESPSYYQRCPVKDLHMIDPNLAVYSTRRLFHLQCPRSSFRCGY